MYRQAVLMTASLTIGLGTQAFSAEFIQNGGFEQTSPGTPSQIGYQGYTVANWESVPYRDDTYIPQSYIFNPALAGSAGFTTQRDIGPLTFNSSVTASPNGGQYYATYGAAPANAPGEFEYHPGTLKQTITGLVVGAQYTLTFLQAAALEQGQDGPYDDQGSFRYSGFNVTFGGDGPTQSGDATPPQSFTPWHQLTYTYTAHAESQELDFTGDQYKGAFALLDGVSLTGPAVPEPATAMLSLVGGAALLRRNRRRTV